MDCPFPELGVTKPTKLRPVAALSEGCQNQASCGGSRATELVNAETMMKDELFRGVSGAQHRQGRALSPASLEVFTAPSLWDCSRFDVDDWDESAANAARDHVRKVRRSGISISTDRSVALRYATNQGRGGWIYVLSRARIAEGGGKEFIIQGLVPNTDKQWGDAEVVVVSDPPGPIAQSAIIRIERVRVSPTLLLQHVVKRLKLALSR